MRRVAGGWWWRERWRAGGSTAPALWGDGWWQWQQEASGRIRRPQHQDRQVVVADPAVPPSGGLDPLPLEATTTAAMVTSAAAASSRIPLPLLPLSLIFFDPGGRRSRGGGSIGCGSSRTDLPVARDGDDGRSDGCCEAQALGMDGSIGAKAIITN
uniref:Uncharacterized protein n=1 Tax=Oryza punctata TaxID=4537 RepID=A0A0E0LKP2_ORYPU